jgi:isoleucyl-tRNA synthetase
MSLHCVVIFHDIIIYGKHQNKDLKGQCIFHKKIRKLHEFHQFSSLSHTMSFPKIPNHPNFPELEEEILSFWKENKTFEKSINKKSSNEPYRFYDGPPFKNGIPHYGSLLQSFIKDAIPRFWTMKGKRVERKWGRDCHGIYIEQKVQAKLNLISNKDIEKYGIQKFIEECRQFTDSVVDEREWCVDHIGRRVDFEHPYQTMDNSYMESVWRVFKNLWDKWLIYKGKRVSMYSTKLNTAISNFEVQADNSYAEVSDPAITVKFPIRGNIQKEEFEYTEDAFKKVAIGVIKNKEGAILMLFNSELGKRNLPGGKVDKGETTEKTLIRELEEEGGVKTISKKEIFSYKVITTSKTFYNTVFEVEIEGVFKNMDADKHSQMAYIKIEESDNELGYQLNIEGTIVDDKDEILNKFMILHHYHNFTKGELNDIAVNQSEVPFSFLARTTTPRTIPANLALVASTDIMYVQIYDKERKEYFILAENLLSKYYKDDSQYLLTYRCLGKELEGLKYQAPYDFYKAENHHQVYLADYVTETDGTGIVHTAPEFGEDDFRTGQKYSLAQTEALDEQGRYTAQVADYKGIYYQEANETIMNDLKEKGLLFKKESITHTVPIDPRAGGPLIYKTQDSWFINIQSVKEKLIEKSKEINWVPDHLRLGRFLKNIETAPDRCISRTRYWATPMPVWTDGAEDFKVLSSREEIFLLDQTGSKILEKKIVDGNTIYRDTLNNQELDLHRPYVDNIWGMENGKKFTRVVEVLDPWLDSGSMPYAQDHYPFENKEKFEQSFPADFIGEGLGQIRAWFYVMHVLGVLLFDSIAYKNVICTGTILGNDGRKMSKSFWNYPDIKPTFEKFGADAIRMLYANSPVLSGGDQPFSEELVREVIKKVHLPLWNSFSFFLTYASIDKFTPRKFSINDLTQTRFENDLDTWIIGKMKQLITDVNDQMELYNMQKATTPIYQFMNDLTNWYIRRSRRRFWKGEMDNEKTQGYETLFVVLVELCKILAPFMPFLTEYIFKALTGKESVHLEDWTVSNPNNKGWSLIKDMDLAKQIVELGLSLRGSLKLKVKQPLQEITINKKINPSYEVIILEELNIKKLSIDESLNNQIKVTCVPNARIVGRNLEEDSLK